MKAIVLGGGSTMGLALLVYLKDQQDISQILVTDIQDELIKERVSWLNDKRFSAKVLDAADYNSLVRAIEGYDIVLNTAPTRDKIPVMKAALKAGANYIDPGVRQIDEKLSLNGEFNKRGLLAIFDMYYSHGFIDIMAAYGIERLDKTDTLDLRWAQLDIVPPSEHSRALYTGFNFEGYIFGHYMLPSRRWENGKMILLPPRAEPEMFTFKGPIGTQEVRGLAEEGSNLARLRPEIRKITFKQSLGADLEIKCKFLADLGVSTAPIDIGGGQMVSSWAVINYLFNNQPTETKKAPDNRHAGCVIVRGVKDGQKIEYRIDAWPSENLVQKHKDIGCAKVSGPERAGVFRSGSPMGSVAVLMARGQIKAKGAFLPAFTVPSAEFLKQEASMGISIEITKTEIL